MKHICGVVCHVIVRVGAAKLGADRYDLIERG